LSGDKILAMRRTKLFLTVSAFFLSTLISFGQKTEININGYSGLFSFRGEGATSNSWIISYPLIDTPTTYTINPFGKKSGFSFGFGLQGQRLTTAKNIYGLGFVFEELTSTVHIYKWGVSGDPAYLEYPADGQTKLKNTFITLNPFIGHRYAFGKLSFDVLTGMDFAFCLESKEKADVSVNNQDRKTFYSQRPKPFMDFRPKIQLKAQKEKFGFIAGYSLGLTNFQTQNNPKAYSSFLRIGFSYQLK
jgi:hypothetical protein